MKKLALFLAFILHSVYLFSQSRLPVGEWQIHLPNNSCNSVAKLGSKIYTGGNGSFMSYDLETNSIKSLSKINGFTQTSVVKLGVSESTNTLIVAYENGQFDLLKDGKITLVNDIFKSSLNGSKKINQLYFYKDLVYLSTDFGVLVYDLNKKQTKEVYTSFNSFEENKKVYSTAILGDTVFVSTASGVYKASNDTKINKLDFNNWKVIPFRNDDEKPIVEHLASYNGKLYGSKQYIYLLYKNGNFVANGDEALNTTIFLPNDYGGIFRGFSYSDNKLWILRENTFFSFDGKSGEKKSIGVESPNDIIVNNEQIWVASFTKGLMSDKDKRGEFNRITINGPSLLTAFNLCKAGNKIIALAGAYDNDYKTQYFKGVFSVYEDGIWQNFKSGTQNVPDILDLIKVRFNTVNNKYYFSSWANGVMEWDGKSKFTIYNQDTPNCLLQSCTNPDFCNKPNAEYCRIADVDYDNNGNLWILNPSPNAIRHNVLFKFSIDEKWDNYVWRGIGPLDGFNYSSEEDGSSPHYYTTQIHVDKYNNKWIASRKSGAIGGLLVFNETKQQLPRYLQYKKNEIEEICGTYVNSIVSDNDGAVWIGTDNGVCFYSDPNEVFKNRKIKASLPVFENYALLKGQNVTSIEVDASNRKWIGTSNSGVWLFNADGSKQVEHFDVSNSPLPSNYIINVLVSSITGEVFINTDKGMVSYGGTSVQGKDVNSNISIYPNPIKSDFDGIMAISGLVNNAVVKITDISGLLVFQTKAEGGLATWNIKDYNGRRPQSGVYLVFSSKEDGSESLVNKIVILD